MNTFLPYPSFAKSAACLDRARLGKQRSETLQVLRTLLGYSSGWWNHPAVKMWRGYEASLAAYACSICEEWIGRGYRDTVLDKVGLIVVECELSSVVDPWWLGDPAFHASHRSNLLRKDAEHYSQFGWQEPSDLPYVWPVP